MSEWSLLENSNVLTFEWKTSVCIGFSLWVVFFLICKKKSVRLRFKDYRCLFGIFRLFSTCCHFLLMRLIYHKWKKLASSFNLEYLVATVKWQTDKMRILLIHVNYSSNNLLHRVVGPYYYVNVLTCTRFMSH